VSDVRLLLEVYRVNESHRGELLALAQAASQKEWWAGYSELDKDYLTFIALEEEADSALYCEAHMMPGLFQTQEYARHVIGSWDAIYPLSERTISRRVEVRLRRQQLLTGPRPLRLSVLLDEAVLMRCIGGREVMHRQLTHLVDLIQLPNVDVRILPLNVPRQPIVGESFILLEFSSSYDVTFPDVVHIESVLAVHTQDDSITHTYRLVWNRLWSLALGTDESLERVRQVAHDQWR
jgi:Domain of unknown function (DUF5753)